MKTTLIGFAVLLSSLALIACDNVAHDGTGGTGGAGGSGAGGRPNVLGTKHNGDCNTATAFAAACEEQGGVWGDKCQWSNCTFDGLSATCFEPHAPAADEFSCDGLFNCKTSEVCRIKDPLADGCFLHECVPIPSGCTADPTCDCVTKEVSAFFCEADAEGHLTLHSTWF